MHDFDVTAAMLDFKESARHLWNTFLCRSGRASVATIESFERIEIELLRELVLRRLGAPDTADAYRRQPMASIIVHPKDLLSEVPLQYAEPQQNGSVRWTTPVILPVA